MDALDIMTNLHLIVPFYQAVFSAEEHRVIGYEVLGRIDSDGEFKSLGSFFHDEAIPEEYRIEVDDTVLSKALDHFLEQEEQPFIFINRDPNLLMVDHGEALLELLLAYNEKGLLLNKIVIEITEHNFKGDIEQLNHLITYYRTYGIKIAIDNIGKENSNFDRIGLLTPDILKIDLKGILKTTTTQSYHDVLYSISLLARKIGATLLYEDIETLFQLQYAWKNGGRYYQGFLLHKPENHLVSDIIMKEKLREEIQLFIRHEKKKLFSLYELSEQLHNIIQLSLHKYKKQDDYNELIKLLANDLGDRCFRLYVCDGDGFQQSANIMKNNQHWIVQHEYYMKNWSWRPYFLENIVRMRYNKKGILSDLYSDVESGENIRTFSYPLTNELYLFIDIPYEFLFENEGLL